MKKGKILELDRNCIPSYIRQMKEQEAQKQLKLLQVRQPEVDRQAMLLRKLDKQKTIEERVREFELKGAEKEQLERVFGLFDKNMHSFGWLDLRKVLGQLNVRMRKSEIALMIWEVDQSLDEQVSFEQFKNMYIRCVMDESGLQSQNLFFLTQFLMYCQPGQSTISVEDTLELIYVRVKNQSEKHPVKEGDDKLRLNQEIKAIFGQDESHIRIDFQQYRARMAAKMSVRRKMIEQSKLIIRLPASKS